MDRPEALTVAEAPPSRSGRDILRATKPFVGERRARSWFDVLSTLSVLGGLILITLLQIPWYGRLGAGFLAGLVAVRMFVLYHDYQHGAILRKSRLARFIMSIYGMLVLSPPSPWNRSHNYHHTHNSKLYGASFGSYPMMTREDWAKAGRWERFTYRAARHPLTIFLGYLTIFLFGMTLRPFLIKPKHHLDCVLALLIHAALITIFAWFHPAGLIFTLWIPILTASALGAYLFYAQHNFPGAELKPKGEWELVHAARRSSSFMVLSPLLHWITGNIGFHQVHHLNPRIPSYRLPEALAAIEELQDAGRTSLSLRDIRRCFGCKLWDPEQNRLVPFSG